MIKPIDRFFGGPNEDDMSGFKIRFAEGTKFYESEDRKLAVWTLAQCVKKLRAARAADPYLKQSAVNMAEWQEKQDKDPMTQKWAAECVAAWQKAFDYVLNEPAPPAEPKETQTRSLFNRG